MGSRGSGFERRRTEDDWWKQQDAEKVAEEEPEKAEEQSKQRLSEDDANNPFSQGRKDNALWTTDKKQVDNVLRKVSGDLYKTFDSETKSAFESYTGSGYQTTNSALADGTVGDGYLKNRVDRLTEAISKAELPIDMWLQRGISGHVADSMFEGDYSLGHIQQMIDTGTIINNKPFMSASGVKGAGFTHNPVILNLYAPKGTKAIYAEPFAVHGLGGHSGWDGESGQDYFGSEFEVLIQRGAQLRPLKVTKGKNGTIYVDAEILGFKYD